MSAIALSALVLPSRRLRFAVGLYALVNLFAAAASLAILHDRLVFSSVCALFFLIAALFLLRGRTRLDMTHRIDVSGTGGLHLTVQQEVGAGPVAATGTDVSMLPGSLLWPHIMLLRLGDADGATYIVPVLRDSLDPTEYRRLRVALGTLDGRAAHTQQGSEIL